MHTVRIAIAGPPGSGKTTWLHRMRHNRFDPKEKPANSAYPCVIVFRTTLGDVQCVFHDDGTTQDRAESCDALVVMRPAGAPTAAPAHALCLPGAPTVTCCSKCDEATDETADMQVSSATCFNLFGPVLAILRNTLQCDAIDILAANPPPPANTRIMRQIAPAEFGQIPEANRGSDQLALIGVVATNHDPTRTSWLVIGSRRAVPIFQAALPYGVLVNVSLPAPARMPRGCCCYVTCDPVDEGLPFPVTVGSPRVTCTLWFDECG